MSKVLMLQLAWPDNQNLKDIMRRSLHRSLASLRCGALAALFLVGATAASRAAEPALGAWRIRVLSTYINPLAHEGPVFIPETQELFFTSNRLKRPDGSQYVIASMFNVTTGKTRDLGLTESIPMANGAFRLRNGSIVVTMQGDHTRPAGLASYNPATGKVQILTKGFASYQFNSPNDVVQAGDLAIWFTDPQYGYEQGFRPKPTMGNWVWRLDGSGHKQRLMMDGFAKPNGIAFSRDQRYIYVTDSGYIAGNGERDSVLPRTIYRYRVMSTPEGPLATDRITFCVVTKGIPDGLKVDEQDRIWTGTGAGLEVFSKDGTPLAVIPIEGGVSNFALTGDGGAYIMGETKLYRLDS
ncbi:SMP-30/gluconolactonase/LRE family protein [Cyanobium sp. BA20m-14]|uniref:SMP-30/gluconolactonase/LRE family protein n=1 Tax=Cyanobium sp. BA20m-14 TaxID=2823703 RepID=UPI0020CBA918|nr:SMP-30/gluconolactonase/LRE family protein [Cyanobium sp. BA20m-14]MCP9914183.1 SMP-30/gluconolactonase/LRE family protein [Cyanobium sp. BA20m-14]